MKHKILLLLIAGFAFLGVTQSTSANCFVITPTSGDYLPISSINPNGVKSMATIETSGATSLTAYNNKSYNTTDLGISCEKAREVTTGTMKLGLYMAHFMEQIDNLFAKKDITAPGLQLVNIYSLQGQLIEKYIKYDFKDKTSWEEVLASIITFDSKGSDIESLDTLLAKMSDDRLIVFSLLISLTMYDSGLHNLYY